MATKRAKPAAKRAVRRVVRNVAAGFTTGTGKAVKFTPFRSSPDYDPRRLSSSTAGKAAEVKLAAKRKRAHAAGMKKAVKRVGRRNPVSGGVMDIYSDQRQLELYDSIKAGKSVTVRVHGGGKRSGVAIMRGPAGWVLRPSTHTGNPPIAYPGNIMSVRAGKLPVARNPLPIGQWTAVDKVKVRSDGSIQIMIRPGR